MRFNAGYFGACAVVLALLGTVLAGFVLSVDKETVPYTNYDYITDVSGLFSYTDTPEYIDYNPSTNYVGYTGGSTTPKYEQTTTANNYRYIIDQPPDRSLGSGLGIGSTAPNHGDYGPMATAGGNTMVKVDSSTIYPGTINSGKITSLGYFLNLWFENFDPTPYSKLILDTSYSPNNSPVYFYCGSWDRIYQNDIQFWYAETTEESAKPVKLIIEVSTLKTYAYNSSNELLWQDVAYNVGCIHIYRTSFSGGTATTSVSLSGTGTPLPIYGYMNPNAGVTLNGAGYINWENGYHNNEVTIKMVKPANNSWVSLMVNGSSFTVGWVSGTLQYWTTLPFRAVQLGDWLGVQFTLNGSTGDVTFTPLYFDLSLVDVAETTAYSVTDSDLIPAGDIDTIRFMNTNVGDTYPRWQVVKTTVFLNTYNTVMYNPSLDIKDYFPDLDEYRLNFYSFALMGTGFNINGTNFDVDRDNATVTFTYGLEPVTQKLKNIYVSTDEGHTYLTFADVNKKYDLGETTTDTVSFTGYWYFSTGLYEAVDGVTSEYVWDLDGAFHADAGQCLVIFLAILGGFVTIGHVYGRVNVKALDWVIIAFAGFMAYVYFGGLIV